MRSESNKPKPPVKLDQCPHHEHADESPAQTLAAPKMWRSLDELANTPEFREAVEREFPAGASEWNDDASRRTFLKVMGASIALAGVGGCVRPTTEKIVPYVRQPEELVPGKPLYFATSATFRGFARGIIAESHEGRPTKIEGNPDHPASLGSADVRMQAHVLNLYDPDRSQIVNYAGEVSNWNQFTKMIDALLADKKSSGGQGIRILTSTVTSPTLAAQMDAFIRAYPNVKWHQYEPINSDNEKLGMAQAFGLKDGEFVNPVYHFDKAKVIVSLDSNFLMDLPGSVRYARDFVNGRRVLPKHGKRAMNRLYVAECTPTIAGAYADERIRVKPSEIVTIARDLLAVNASNDFLKKLTRDLDTAHGASLVVAGDSQPPEVHAIAAALNSKLGNIGKTVDYIPAVEYGYPENGQTESLRSLVADIKGGSVDLLIMIGGNPVYDAPVDLDFEKTLKDMSTTMGKTTVHLSEYYDETSFNVQWHLPMSHELEGWGDARAYDGTASIMQPLIAPLYQGRSPSLLMSILLGAPNRGGLEIVQEYWQKASPGADFDTRWDKWLNDGLVADSAAAPTNVSLSGDATKQTAPAAAGGKEIIFRPDPYIWDGRYANNGWLMECPRPLTKLTWDNAAIMSPKTAAEYGVLSDNYTSKPRSPVLNLSVNGQPPVKAALWVQPGHPDDCVTVHLGFGRNRAGRIGGNVEEQPGFDAYKLRTSGNLWSAGGVAISDAGEEMKLACVQNHAMMDQHDRDILHVREINQAPEAEAPRTVSLSLYPPYPYPDDVRQGNKWGMVIDQNACIGCNACVVACQAENNIAVVGKEEVGRGREMQWLRIDHYYLNKPSESNEGMTLEEQAQEAEGPFFQPLPCMHCENAPCEVVCPANATMHDAEGTNNMVYNRCIGTRYCSNNCPYKVRHFNFFNFNADWINSEVQKMVSNPNVTVRSRGVMEKCSYCIQRISVTRINAKKEFVNGLRKDKDGNPTDAIFDGEVVTACQQSCPTQAIYFGNINDKDLSRNGAGSVVREMKEEEGNYTLLEELQTLPRTSYLPRYTNRAEKV
jgi:molybdopterin-containing oxidoreductase family iron-sulfur binding subunit